ncbi:flagellar motor switch phosphatase FliY [Virgibacillus halophilus]|uniref:flagellar motor switch phosphatase FliY n=1 Tax=Tigheibacillus halophilus TaxID=361280 RepID=UPI0036361A36
MNDGMLSQEEIDALLKIGSGEEAATDKVEKNQLTPIEKDTLGEIGNISFGSSATTLSTLLNEKVEITTPSITVMNEDNVVDQLEFEHLRVEITYKEGFTGKSLFIIKKEDAAIISDIMLGGDGTNPDEELNEIHLSAVQEAMNQMMGASATSMSTIFGKKVDISPPVIGVNGGDQTAESMTVAKEFVKVSFQLKVGDLIDSNIMQVIPMPFAKELAGELLAIDESQEDQGNVSQETAYHEEAAATVLADSKPAPSYSTIYAAEQNDHDKEHEHYIGAPVDKNHAKVQQASFSEFERGQLNNQEKRNLDMLLDIPLKVTVELGRTSRTIKEILELSAGSIVELDKLAGEPVDILVNAKLIAKGEVVVIDENFGVRITEIASQTDRLLKLK